ncbi:MAG: Lon-like protease helical domain-containing protein [Candidatus Ratteibacteria bacterium]
MPDDWCYVHNFANPGNPISLRLPAGMSLSFKKDMEELVKELQIELPKELESQLYEEHKNQIIKDFQKQKNEILEEFENSAKAANFQIKKTPSGIIMVPSVEGKPP